jgi:hypothetical protein
MKNEQPCKNVQSAAVVSGGCGLHGVSWFLSMGLKYTFCRYQFVVNTFFICLSPPFDVFFIVFMFYTHTICPFSDISYMIIRAVPKYKPLHITSINKHIQRILTPKTASRNHHKTEKRVGNKNNTQNAQIQQPHKQLEIITQNSKILTGTCKR